jgi:hypothetical protein
VVVLAAGLCAAPLWAETTARKRQAADELVQEALGHELYARDQQRAELLARAVKLAPDQPAAHWHQGQVRVGRQWASATALVESDSQRRLRELYEQRRAATPDTPEGQLALADWCVTHRLPAQETAHLNRVLQLAPDHGQARQRLQFERTGDNWVHRQDLWQGLRQSQQLADALRTWRRKLDDLRASLRRNVPRQTALLVERLQAEIMPEAVPAVELVLGNDSEPGAQVAVQILGDLAHHDAAAALARLAVLAPWPAVREAAAEQLRPRPRDHYVPLLLTELSTPIESRFQAVLVNGRILYRHAFARETQERVDTAVLDTVMDRRPSLVRPGSNLARDQADTRARAMTDAQATAYAREWERLRQNQAIDALNERICQALRAATEVSLPNSPEAWWTWWNQQNEVTLASAKSVGLRYRQELREYEDVRPSTDVPTGQTGGSTPFPTRSECFVAGTLVWTAKGPVEIEKIQVGDLVLSQEPNTGELAFQPVLQTTQRPPEQLIKVRLVTRYEDTLEGSGGHPLWVAGEGWINLRQLQSGMVLHGIDGATVVSDVESGRTQPTHNLVVADFHTYVVGAARLLCHDNTPRRPTSALVPGLVPR